jgi:hypothetical protein
VVQETQCPTNRISLKRDIENGRKSSINNSRKFHSTKEHEASRVKETTDEYP